MWLANDYARFQADTAAFHESLAQHQNPESDDQAMSFKQWSSNTLMPFVTQTSAKYSDNPKIMTAVQKLIETNNKGMDDFVAVKGAQAQEENAAANTTNAQTNQATEGRMASREPVEQEQMKAQTGLANAQAGYYNRMPQAAGSKKTDPQTFIDMLKEARNPKDDRAKYRMDLGTEQDVLSRVVTANKNQLYPSGAGLWGSDPDEDKKQALDYLRQSNLLKDVQIAGRMASMAGDDPDIANQLFEAGLNPEAISLVYPNAEFRHGNEEEKAHGKIKEDTNPSDVVSVITGTPRGPNFKFDDLDQYYEEVVDNTKSYKDLPPTLRGIFGFVRKNKLGQPITQYGDPETGQVKETPLHSQQDFIKVLRDAARATILDKRVEPGTKAYEKVNEFIDKTIIKFLPELINNNMPPEMREKFMIEPKSFLQDLKQKGIEFPHLLKGAGKLAKDIKLLWDINTK